MLRCRSRIVITLFLALLAAACHSSGVDPNAPHAAPPAISVSTANGVRNGAVIVTLTSPTPKAAIYYTLDGSTPGTASTEFLAPFLLAANGTLRAVATAPGYNPSPIATQAFSPNIHGGALIWSDEFDTQGTAKAGPNPAIWGYEVGLNCCGNDEKETYCAWASSDGPCDPAHPSAYIAADNLLHIDAVQTKPGVYTSARMTTEGRFAFQYGRIEARMLLPESQGIWPAFWMMGTSRATVDWPDCGEADIMEHIDGANPDHHPYDWIKASLHARGLDAGELYHGPGFSAAKWHTYGMKWKKRHIEFYVDSPSNVYERLDAPAEPGKWPFDQGPMFLLLNLAVGGGWPGNPDATTVFPSTMLVDYVRIYAN